MNEISSSPGILAKKIGVSKRTMMRHLNKTGLIVRCYRDLRGYWRIPYNVAVSLASPEALAVQPQTTRTIEVPRRKRVTQPEPENKPPQEQTQAQFPPPVNYAEIGRALSQAGITLRDVINYFSQQRQVRHDATRVESDSTTE